MRISAISLLLLGLAGTAQSAYQQELIPILRETRSTPTPSVTQWNTYIQLANYDGVHYVSLVQLAALLNGHLKLHTVAKTVDFAVHGQKIRFAYYSRDCWINGNPTRLDYETVKNDDGFWVPISFFASEIFFDSVRAKLLWPPPSEKEES